MKTNTQKYFKISQILVPYASTLTMKEKVEEFPPDRHYVPEKTYI